MDKPEAKREQRRNPLVAALDLSEERRLVELCRALRPWVSYFKVGSELFLSLGRRSVEIVRAEGGRVFLDLKFHDIPQQVRQATAAAAAMGVDLLTVHTLGGKRMLEAAKQGALEGAGSSGQPVPSVLGVSVLTSLDDQDLGSVGIAGPVASRVKELVSLAIEANLDGIVASAAEAAAIRAMAGPDFKIVTPGLAAEGGPSASWDQKRVASPEEAVAAGASLVVLGRSLLSASDPAQRAQQILERIDLSS